MDLLLSCVSETQPRWLRRAEDLVRSVRWFGGRVADARFVVNFVGEPPAEQRAALAELGAEVRVVEAVDGRFPLANKLRMLELHAEAEFDVLVGLDCDLVVVGDFSDRVSASQIAAKPCDYDLFSEREWTRLYGTVGLRPPARTLLATSSGKRVGPYFNTGVVTVPRSRCAELRDGWGECHRELMALLEREPTAVRPDLHSYVWDQVAFALALARGDLPWATLPVAMNFPCHVGVHRAALAESPEPMILHHHGRLDPDGFLLRPRSAAAAAAADRFNRVRAERLSLDYAGLQTRFRRFRRLRNRLSRTFGRATGRPARLRQWSVRSAGSRSARPSGGDEAR